MAKSWVLIQVPYGGGYSSLNLAKPKGAKYAPAALKKEFERQIIFMADNGVSSWDNVLWQEINLKPGSKNSIEGWENMADEVCDALDNIGDWDNNRNFLFLGGSHSITAATYNSMASQYGIENTGLVVLDAHPDCCKKADWPIHSDWLRWLIEDRCILPENVLIVGLRQIEKAEQDFMENQPINYYMMNQIGDPIRAVTDNLPLKFNLEKLAKLKAVYLSIDIDVVSGVYAPGTGCPSPGGFTDSEIIAFIKQLKIKLPNLRAVDIVEIDPLNWWRKKILRYDTTVDLGIKLMKEIIS